MAFTYTEDLTVERDFVRFHTGDTESDKSYLSDAIITSLISVEGSKEAAVIAALRYIITKLSQPNFTADWLTVDNKSARDGFMSILREKEGEFGLSTMTSGGRTAYRGDSSQTEAPDYTDGRGPGGFDQSGDNEPLFYDF